MVDAAGGTTGLLLACSSFTWPQAAKAAAPMRRHTPSRAVFWMVEFLFMFMVAPCSIGGPSHPMERACAEW